MAATAAALAAAFLNGVFGFCLGCEMYVLIRRIWPGSRVRGPGVPYLEELTRADTDVLVAAGVGRTGEAALIPRWWDARTARRTRTWSTGSNLAGRQAVPVA
jgi:hypothetical protein